MLGLKHEQPKAVFDIFCENEKGEFFIVEMQKTRQKYFSDRILYYASFAIQQQTAVAKEKTTDCLSREMRARWNYSFNKVYIVCILNYIMAPSHPDKYRWDVVRMDRELKIPFSETLNEVYLGMSANERLEYELSLAAERDMLAALDAKFEDGEMKGKEEGLTEGLAKGIAKIAIKMKQAGKPLSEIIEFTGLTAVEIERL